MEGISLPLKFPALTSPAPEEEAFLDQEPVGSNILWLERRKRIESRAPGGSASGNKRKVYTTREKLDAIKIMKNRYNGSAYSTASALELAPQTMVKWRDSEEELKKQDQIERKSRPKLTEAQKEAKAAAKKQPKPPRPYVPTGKNRFCWMMAEPRKKRFSLKDLGL